MVDGIAFLLTLSRRIEFVTVKHTPSRTAKNLVIHLKRVIHVYHCAGFTMKYVLVDGEFEKNQNELPFIVGNTNAVKQFRRGSSRQVK